VRRLWVFFYGSFMSPDVLARADVHPADPQTARLDGWELTIAPRATLIPAPGRSVHGVVARLTHAELDRLYAKDFFGFGAYLPEAVLVTIAPEDRLPAITYISWELEGGRPAPDYVEKILSVACERSFPEEYVRHVRSFL
jgi:hypothetical protein